MNQAIFTVEEENLICAFDTSSRNALIQGIRMALTDFDEPELYEIAGNVLRILETMTDGDYSLIVFSPAYSGDETEV